MNSFVVKVIEFDGQQCVPIPGQLMKKLDWKVGDKVIVDLTVDKKSILVRKLE